MLNISLNLNITYEIYNTMKNSIRAETSQYHKSPKGRQRLIIIHW